MKDNKKKRKLSIYKIIGLLLFVFSIVLCTMVGMLDILPTKYFLAIVIIFLIINIPIDMFLFRKKAKKYKRNIAMGFSVFFILVMNAPILYMGKTLAFLWWGVGDTDYKLMNYSVVVLNDSNYKKINDIKGLDVGYYENASGIKKAKKRLSTDVEVGYKSYDSLDSISQDLLDGNIEVILVEDSILSMINEDNDSFEESTRVIYTFSVMVKSVNSAKDVNVVSEPFNVYITGIDTYGDISSVSRSDVNIVMTVNPKTKQILLTSIPRDYYVQLHGQSGTKDKLTHAGIYGTDMSIATIEDLLDIEINYYIKVNFSSFIDIIDAIGGVDVYSKYTFTSMDGFHYTEGYNKMNGEEALSFARERKAFAEGDRQRGADQQAVIEAIIRKVCSKSILTKYDSLLSSIDGEFQTNMSYKKITSLIKMQLNDMATWNVTSIGLDGDNGSEYTYTGGNQKLYVMIPDEDSIDEASAMIKAVLNGDKLDGSYKKSTSTSKKVSKSSSNSGTSSSIVNSNTNSTKEDNNTVKESNSSSENKQSDNQNTLKNNGEKEDDEQQPVKSSTEEQQAPKEPKEPDEQETNPPSENQKTDESDNSTVVIPEDDKEET